MSCRGDWGKYASDLEIVARTAAPAVDGRPRCVVQTCNLPLLNGDKCVRGHPQGAGEETGVTVPVEVGQALLCLLKELPQDSFMDMVNDPRYLQLRYALAQAEGRLGSTWVLVENGEPKRIIAGKSEAQARHGALEQVRLPFEVVPLEQYARETVAPELLGEDAPLAAVRGLVEMLTGNHAPEGAVALHGDPRLRAAQALVRAAGRGPRDPVAPVVDRLRDGGFLAYGRLKTPVGQADTYRFWAGVLEETAEAMTIAPSDAWVTTLLDVRPGGTANFVIIAGQGDEPEAVLVRDDLPTTDGLTLPGTLTVATDVRERAQRALHQYRAGRADREERRELVTRAASLEEALRDVLATHDQGLSLAVDQGFMPEAAYKAAVKAAERAKSLLGDRGWRKVPTLKERLAARRLEVTPAELAQLEVMVEDSVARCRQIADLHTQWRSQAQDPSGWVDKLLQVPPSTEERALRRTGQDWEEMRDITEQVRLAVGVEVGPLYPEARYASWGASAHLEVLWEAVRRDSKRFPTALLRERAVVAGLRPELAEHANRKELAEWGARRDGAAAHMLVQAILNHRPPTMTAAGRDGIARTWRANQRVQVVTPEGTYVGRVEHCGLRGVDSAGQTVDGYRMDRAQAATVQVQPVLWVRVDSWPDSMRAVRPFPIAAAVPESTIK